MGSKSSKCKRQKSTDHIFYAVKFKKCHELSIIDSDVIKTNTSIKNNDSNMYITFDVDELKNLNDEAIWTKLNKGNILDCESSKKLREVVQLWANNNSEDAGDHTPVNSSNISQTRMDWEEQRKTIKTAPSKGKLLWISIDEKNNRNVKNSAAQAGSFVNLRENAIVKSRSHKGSSSSGSTTTQKEIFSDSRSRSRSENFGTASKRRSKHSVRSINQLDSAFETNSKYSSDNLSETPSTSRMRDLDLRLKGAGTSESRNKSSENEESRYKKVLDSREIKTSRGKSDTEESSTLTNDYIDARWQALCSSSDKEQILVPCPTCGRRFNQEAAYRHFPICSRVKEKESSVKTPRNVVRQHCRSPSSPSFINVMPDDPLTMSKLEDGTVRKPTKPIVYTFTRGGKKSSGKAAEMPKSADHCHQIASCSTKNYIKSYSPTTSKKGSGNSIGQKSDVAEPRSRKRRTSAPRSDGVRKSASIWRKSIKEFKMIVDTTVKTSDKVKESHSSATDESSNRVEPGDKEMTLEECRDKPSTSESRVCYSCGKASIPTNEKNRVGSRAKSRSRKSFNGKYKTLNSKPVSRSAKDMTNLQDLDIIPQSLRIKDNVNLKKCVKIDNCYFDSFEDKNEPCFFCGRLIRSSLMDSHAYLCERIKNIEEIISKNNLKSEEASTFSGIHSCKSKKQLSGGASSGSDVIRVDSLSPKDYRLYKQGGDSTSGTSLKTITSIKCPCCSQLLDLRRKNN